MAKVKTKTQASIMKMRTRIKIVKMRRKLQTKQTRNLSNFQVVFWKKATKTRHHRQSILLLSENSATFQKRSQTTLPSSRKLPKRVAFGAPRRLQLIVLSARGVHYLTQQQHIEDHERLIRSAFLLTDPLRQWISFSTSTWCGRWQKMVTNDTRHFYGFWNDKDWNQANSHHFHHNRRQIHLSTWIQEIRGEKLSIRHLLGESWLLYHQ